jgi:hypothetical protein
MPSGSKMRRRARSSSGTPPIRVTISARDTYPTLLWSKTTPGGRVGADTAVGLEVPGDDLSCGRRGDQLLGHRRGVHRGPLADRLAGGQAAGTHEPRRTAGGRGRDDRGGAQQPGPPQNRLDDAGAADHAPSSPNPDGRGNT